MAFKASELVKFCKSMVGQPYWYGTVVYPCTESRLKAKAKQYPTHYAESRMSKYRQDIADHKVSMDCVGMIKGFFWTNGGQGVTDYINGGASYTNKYGANGCPDKSANGMLDWCKSKGCEWGTIATLPDVIGIPVYMPGHVGVYIGNGEVIEARGFNYGVVKTKLKNRAWKHWAYLPSTLIEYPNEVPKVLGCRVLKLTSPLMQGADVTDLQTRLNAIGYDCGKADGEFGKKTETGVIAFQKAVGIEVDGKFGKESLNALNNYDKEKTYTVVKGDTLGKIALNLLGSGSRYREIVELNSPDNVFLEVGQKLKIPLQ